METAIESVGFRAEWKHMITKPPPFKGLTISIPVTIPIKARVVIIVKEPHLPRLSNVVPFWKS